MHIKCAGLSVSIPDTFPAVYCLIGAETYQLSTIADQIKTSWLTKFDSDIKTVYINQDDDWEQVTEETNTYSLFNTNTLIDIRYDKKVLENRGKEFFSSYLKSINNACLLLFRAPSLALKQVQVLSSEPQFHIIQLLKMDKRSIQHWIQNRLQLIDGQYDKKIPDFIQHYTQGNLLAAAQFLDKLVLLHDKGTSLNLDFVKEHLIVQCEYSLFELADAMLQGNISKAVHLLRQARENKTEATLILWLITQETRYLIQLVDPNSSMSFKARFDKLKIWSSRLSLYQNAVKRFHYSDLVEILQQCCVLDTHIKTGQQSQQLWQQFELILLSLCSGNRLLTHG